MLQRARETAAESAAIALTGWTTRQLLLLSHGGGGEGMMLSEVQLGKGGRERACAFTNAPLPGALAE